MNLPLEGGAELRLLTPDDVDAVYALAQRNIEWLQPWMSWAHPSLSRSEVLARMERMAHGRAAGTDFQFYIFDNAELAGVISVHVLDAEDRIVRIGYWLDKDATGKGLVTKGVRALLSFVFDTLGMHRIEVRCAPDNLKSRAIPERLGFTNEGTQRDVLRMADGTYQSLVMYSLLSSDGS